MNNIIFNNNNNDPFSNKTYGKIHLRIEPRLGKKYITIIQSLNTIVEETYDYNKLLKIIKKALCCGGSVKDHKEYGKIIMINGDKRQCIKNIIIKEIEIDEEQIEIHGY